MSAPVPLSYAEKGNCTERKKDRANNISIPRPSEDCAEQRQGGEQSKVARLGVHSRSRLERGSDQAAPPPVRELMFLEPLMLASPAGGRQAIFLGATGPRAARPEETPPRSGR